MQTILFRVDASAQIGTGHVMRCLALADFIYKQVPNAQICFVCRSEEGHLCATIEAEGYKVFILSDSAFDEMAEASEMINVMKSLGTVQMVIVDHYKLDICWEMQIRHLTKMIVVIDDLANRKHDCDILLDQNYRPTIQGEYVDLVPQHCKLFLGLQHLLLRAEFYDALDCTIKADEREYKNILVFYGGSDPTNETEKALEAICKYSWEKRNLVKATVILGVSNAQKREIAEKYKNEPIFTIFEQVNNMALLIQQSDIAFGAGGVAMWERCVLGLPAIITIVAENQIKSVEAAADNQAVINLGWHTEVTSEHLYYALEKVIENSEMLDSLSKNSKKLVSINMGGGVADYSSSCANYIVDVLRRGESISDNNRKA